MKTSSDARRDGSGSSGESTAHACGFVSRTTMRRDEGGSEFWSVGCFAKQETLYRVYGTIGACIVMV